MKKKLPQTSILDAMQLLQSACIGIIWSIGINRKELFSKKWDFWKISGAGDYQKRRSFQRYHSWSITELRERLPKEALEELNATDLLDVDAELSTNGEKPRDAEIIAEIRGEVPDDKDETDIDFVIDDPKVPHTEIEIEKAIF